MQQMRFIGPSDDGASLLLLNEETGERCALPVTDALRLALLRPPEERAARPIAAARPIGGPPAPPPAPTMSPRDIQVRVRAGELPEDLAIEAGVARDRIERFASAVLQERARVAAEARRARARRGGADGELVIFGETVDARFAEHGIDPSMVLWDAVREAEGPWTIKAAWALGDVTGTASWTLELGPRLMFPDDPTAVELLSNHPVPPRATLATSPRGVPAAGPDGRYRYARGADDPGAWDPAAADADDPAAGPGASRPVIDGAGAWGAQTRRSGAIRALAPRTDDGFFDQEAPDKASDDAEPTAPTAPIAQLSAFFAPAPAPGARAEAPRRLAEAERAPGDPGRPADQLAPSDAAGGPDGAHPGAPQTPGPVPAQIPHPARAGAPHPVAVERPTPRDPQPPEARVPHPGGPGANSGSDGDLADPAEELAAELDQHDQPDEEDADRRARIPSWDDILLGVRRKRD